MKTAATVAQWTVRMTGLIQIVLGVLFWTGNAPELIPLHILSGLILVLALWVLAFIGARSGVPAPLVAVAGAWGLLVVVLGLTQTQILLGGAHWVVQILHLLIGVGAIGQAEGLGARIRQSRAAAVGV